MWRGAGVLPVCSAPARQDDQAIYLVRPDGYVAWATSAAEPDDTDCKALRAALERWFGTPVDM